MKQASLDLETAMARYMPYLMEIRKRLLYIVAIFLVAASIGTIYFQKVVKFVMNLYDLKGVTIAFTSPFQSINLAIDSGIIIGIIVIFPLFVYQTLSFLKPALKEREYHFVLKLIPVGIVLFLIGFTFGFWIMKFVVSFFSQQSNQFNIQSLWDIEHFLSQVILTALFMGILFQFPIVISTLIRFKVVKYQTITDMRLPIYAGLVILTIMMPPTDVLSDFLIFFPLAFLFESTLLFNRSFK